MTEPEPLLVPPDLEKEVWDRVASGNYRNADKVLELAVGLLLWAETDPIGQQQLRRLEGLRGVGNSEPVVPAQELLAKRPLHVESRHRRRYRRRRR